MSVSPLLTYAIIQTLADNTSVDWDAYQDLLAKDAQKKQLAQQKKQLAQQNSHPRPQGVQVYQPSVQFGSFKQVLGRKF